MKIQGAGSPSEDETKRAWAEAAAWVVKLQGSGRDSALEAGWRAWMSERPDHIFAWEIASETWARSHDIPLKVSLPANAHALREKRRRTILPKLAAAASFIAVLVCGWLWYAMLYPSYSTATGEQRTVSLNDGTRVELNTNTRIRLEFGPQVRRVVLTSGEAYFAVAHERRPFVVMVGDRKVIAVGTAFVVRKTEQRDAPITVTLIEGRVAIADAGAADKLPDRLPDQPSSLTLLRSGERLQVRHNGRATVDSPSIERATGWMRGQVIFDRTSLADAVTELNRYSSSVHLAVDSSAADIELGGSFRVGDAENFARAVAASYQLSLVKRGNELILARTDAKENQE